MTFKNFKLVLLFLFIFFLVFKVSTDTDLGWHIRVGEFISQNRQIPTHDLFSFSLPDYPYYYHSWSSELLIYYSYKYAGLLGVSTLYAATIFIALVFAYRTCLLLSSKRPPYVLMLLWAPLFYAADGGRTRGFGLLFLTMIFYLLASNKVKLSKTIYLIPFLMAAWANFHGSFPIGIFFIGMYCAIYQRKYFFITFLSFVATLLNPIGPRIWTNSFEISNRLILSQVNSDWQSLALQPGGIVIIFMFLATSALIWYLKTSEFKKDLLLLGILSALSLISSKWVFAPLVVLVPLSSKIVYQIPSKLKFNFTKNIPTRFAVASIYLVLLLSVSINLLEMSYAYRSLANYFHFLPEFDKKTQKYPAFSFEANSVLANSSASRIFNEGNWGSFMIFLNPKTKVFFYSAMDNYQLSGQSFALEYLKIAGAYNGWREKLDAYKIDTVYLPPYYPLTKKLANDKLWKKLYENKYAVIFRRS